MTETLLRYEFPSNEKLRTFLRLADLFKQLTWFAQQENSNDHRAAIIKYFEIQEVTTRGDQKNDLLHELDAQPLCQQQAARSRDGDGHALRAEVDRGLLQHFHDGGAHVGMMAAVHRPQNLVVVVEHRQLHRGRPHVDADVEGAGRRGGTGGSGDLGGVGASLLHRRDARRAGGARRGRRLLHGRGRLGDDLGVLAALGVLLHWLTPNLQLDGLAGLDEQKAHGDARHSLGGFGAAALDPVGDDP